MLPRSDSAEMKLLLHHFEKRELSAYEVSKLLGISVRNARPYLTMLHERQIIYIVAWRHPINGPKVPVYALRTENEADVRMPPPKKIVRSRELCRNPLNKLLFDWTAAGLEPFGEQEDVQSDASVGCTARQTVVPFVGQPQA